MSGTSAPVYVPGRKVVCTSEEIPLEFYTRGWCAPERDHIRIDGAEGELRFIVRRPAISYTFVAEVDPIAAPPAWSLEIFFNHFRVDYLEIGARGEVRTEFPAELFILRTSILRLHCPAAAVGLDQAHRSGIALHSWMLT